jgi:hypothetical protein
MAKPTPEEVAEFNRVLPSVAHFGASRPFLQANFHAGDSEFAVEERRHRRGLPNISCRPADQTGIGFRRGASHARALATCEPEPITDAGARLIDSTDNPSQKYDSLSGVGITNFGASVGRGRGNSGTRYPHAAGAGAGRAIASSGTAIDRIIGDMVAMCRSSNVGGGSAGPEGVNRTVILRGLFRCKL